MYLIFSLFPITPVSDDTLVIIPKLYLVFSLIACLTCICFVVALPSAKAVCPVINLDSDFIIITEHNYALNIEYYMIVCKAASAINIEGAPAFLDPVQ